MNIYFLIVNYYSTEFIRKLIFSIKNIGLNYTKIVIVNNSIDDLEIQELLINHNIEILQAKNNQGFAQACNQGLKCIEKENNKSVVWLINPDSYFANDSWQKDFITLFKQSPVSFLGTKINNQLLVGTFNAKTGMIKEKVLPNLNLDKFYQPCDWVSGCSLLIDLEKFNNCPQFDPNYFLYYEDFDFCQRYSKQGHIIAVSPLVNIIHETSSITNKNILNKTKHSTFSYLYTLHKYTNIFIFTLHLSKLLVNTCLLLFYQPQIFQGKLLGVQKYIIFMIKNRNINND
jgi:GT2 family glycosyltransferase